MCFETILNVTRKGAPYTERHIAFRLVRRVVFVFNIGEHYLGYELAEQTCPYLTRT